MIWAASGDDRTSWPNEPARPHDIWRPRGLRFRRVVLPLCTGMLLLISLSTTLYAQSLLPSTTSESSRTSPDGTSTGETWLEPFLPTHLTMHTRLNVRRTENGIYRGHTLRESRGVFQGSVGADGLLRYSGRSVLYEDTLREARRVGRGVEGSYNAEFGLDGSGAVHHPHAAPYPDLIGVPSFPNTPLKAGDVWRAPAIAYIALSAAESGAGHGARTTALAVPVNVAYRYEGMSDYNGRSVHHVEIEYGLRFPYLISEELANELGMPREPAPDAPLRSASGAHRITLLIAEDGFTPVLFRDTLRRELQTLDGRTLGFEGFSLTWFRAGERLLSPDMNARIAREIESIPDTESREVPEGLLIEIRSIRFEPNLAVFLPEELPRIDRLAALLRDFPDRSILLIGHTAAVGDPDRQDSLSVERAAALAEALGRRGVNTDRLLYEGRGAREPVADNATEEGRAANRRVELIILSDTE